MARLLMASRAGIISLSRQLARACSAATCGSIGSVAKLVFRACGICKPLKSLDSLLDSTSKNRTLRQNGLRQARLGWPAGGVLLTDQPVAFVGG